MKDPIVGYDAEGKPFAVFCGECLGSCALVTPSRSLEEAIQQEREHCHPRCPLCGAERARNTFCAPCASAREQKDLETFFLLVRACILGSLLPATAHPWVWRVEFRRVS